MISFDRAESALVVRVGDDVLVLPVARSDAMFVRSLQATQPLASALEAATLLAGATEAFDLIAALSLLIR